ncbi:MAG: hypothetical protein JRF62_17565 [Deltaproteobacteria bacterium]|nr:hypothetical protein [Deltaproteobacteria bacterium]
MPRFIKRHSKKADIGEKKTEETKITLIDFDEAHLQEQIIDTIESYRDILGGMLDIYLSTVSNKMNEVMKVLTIIATIFIPITFVAGIYGMNFKFMPELTFVAGIYGMNFKFMPELEWRWGYVMVWAIIVVVAGIMIGFFKKKQWL